MRGRGRVFLARATVAILGFGAAAWAADKKPAPLVIEEQGSFALGGTVVTAPGTDTPRRPRLRLLPGPGQRPTASARDVAWARPVREDLGDDTGRARGIRAKQWRDVVNTHGGDATLVHLPEVGIRGNTHFPMSDLNNLQIADLLSQYLAAKRLD